MTTAGHTGRAPEPLTRRQEEVLELLRRGFTNEEIAGRLGISLDGAKWHVSEIIGRLGVANRYEAARWRPEGERKPSWSLIWLRGLRWSTAARGASAATLALVAIAVIAFAWGVWRTNDDTMPIAPPAPDRAVSRGMFEDVRGWIAFRDGDNVIAVDPANPGTRVSLAPSLGRDPIGWSADGTQLLLLPRSEPIVFFSNEMWMVADGDFRAIGGAVMHADRSTTGLSTATWGSFSPDGKKILYATNGSCSESRSPYVVDVNGGQAQTLGAPPERRDCGEPLGEWAAWAPDGSRIALVDYWENHPPYGDHMHTLSFFDPATGATLGDPINIEAADPAWSPDGSRLAFWAAVPDIGPDFSNSILGPSATSPAQIFVINADGSRLRQLTTSGDNRWPTWSPDGSRIAFARGQLSFNTAPDGSQAASVPGGSRELFTMAADGTDVRRVEGVNPEGAIAWNPAR